MKKKIKDKKGIADITPEIRFDYIKTNHYREAYINGAYGGVTPNGMIQMSVFSERLPIPNQVAHELLPDGNLGNEILAKRLSRQSIIRSVESTLIMDIKTAAKIKDWLENVLSKSKPKVK